METITQTNPNNRELTTTEIKIAIAQVEDRLSRIALAQEEYSQDDYDDPDAFILEMRKKYNLPECVDLCHYEAEGALIKHHIPILKPYISAFIRGQLTDETFNELYLFLEEIGRCSYDWVLIENETPMSFDVMKEELRKIGTRSPRKAELQSRLRNELIRLGWLDRKDK